MLQKPLPNEKDLFRLYINEFMQTEIIPFDFLDNIQLLCNYIHNIINCIDTRSNHHSIDRQQGNGKHRRNREGGRRI